MNNRRSSYFSWVLCACLDSLVIQTISFSLETAFQVAAVFILYFILMLIKYEVFNFLPPSKLT
ncbi:hypothetical protein SAMN04487992_1086 [Cellulophaga baltica]|uniref:Uncharacterized protein n=1 Tax=Cellulophaga baltica TaxID=76594 RepID=A0A1G7ISP2_9FLAO|nr:hypothetical protein SAMN04487992_1086 [Cellulophaga baltica]